MELKNKSKSHRVFLLLDTELLELVDKSKKINLSKKTTKIIRFIFGLTLLNILPVVYLNLVNLKIVVIYIMTIFLLINISILIDYFKIKEVEIESPIGKLRVKR